VRGLADEVQAGTQDRHAGWGQVSKSILQMGKVTRKGAPTSITATVNGVTTAPVSLAANAAALTSIAVKQPALVPGY
jgi:hypothetical protein